MSSITNTTAPGDAWHSPRASRCKASTLDHLAVTFKAAFCTTTPASRAPLSNEKPVSLLDVTSLVDEGSSGAGLALPVLMSSSPSTLFRGDRWRTRLMNRLTRRVFVVGARYCRGACSALAAVACRCVFI